jgi:hypothetical protein
VGAVLPDRCEEHAGEGALLRDGVTKFTAIFVVKTTGSTLTTVDGIGSVLTARVLGRTRRPSRFARGSQFAAHVRIAPIEVASAERARHRLCHGLSGARRRRRGAAVCR